MKKNYRLVPGLLTVVASLSMMAYSSGSGAVVIPPAAPVVSLSIVPPKGIQLSWAAVPGATHYRVLKKPDGVSPFSIIAGNMIELEYTDMVGVHLQDWVDARYGVVACNASGCTHSLALQTLGLSADAIGYFKASNTEERDLFGWSLALSGDGLTLAVGAYLEDSDDTGIDGVQTNLGADTGAVYVFRQDAGDWDQVAYIKASNTDSFDGFGAAISLNDDGTVLAVTSPGEDSNAFTINGDEGDNTALSAGAAYLFRYDGSIWTQDAYIKGSNTEAGDQFGYSVSLSGDGDTLTVGAIEEDSADNVINGDDTDNTADGAGAVYVFSYDGIDWAQQAYIKASNTDADDAFGSAVALSGNGNSLAVSAQHEESSAIGIHGDQLDNTADNAGAVYVFSRAGSTWLQQAYIKAANTEAGDYFGVGLALSADGLKLAVGAPFESSNAIGIGGDMSDNSAGAAGAVYVYYHDGSDWQPGVYLKASNTESGDFFGVSVGLDDLGYTLVVGAMSEDSLAVGANGDESDNSVLSAGAAYVFTRIGGNWSQQSYLKASNTDPSDPFGLKMDFFGAAVSISADGNSLAISAQGEESAATGFDDDQADNTMENSGAVYLY